MAEKLGLGPEIRELKLGSSFRNPRSTAFHTVRYDFKPASVDINKTATIDVGSNNQITVNVPHLDGSGTSQTVFKGSQKPYQRECVLIIDRNTGEITLEKLTSNIQVKKTRSESNHKPIPPHLEKVVNNEINNFEIKSKLPTTKLPNNKNRKDRLPIPKNSPKNQSPAHSSPAPSRLSPSKRDLPPKSSSASPVVVSQQVSYAGNLPVLGDDDFVPNSTITKSSTASKSYNKMNQLLIPETSSNNVKSSQLSLSASSSSSSSSSDDSESESDSKTNNFPTLSSNVKVSDSSDSDSEDSDLFEPSTNSKSLSMPNPDQVPDHVLKEDLCLSESGSDSD